MRVPAIELNEQDVIDGIAVLGGITGLPISVEFPLGRTISRPAPQLKTFKTRVGPGTVSEVLNELCSVDVSFVWLNSGRMINVLPRASVNDGKYFLNRTFDELTFDNLTDAQAAVFRSAEQLPGPKEQIAVLESGPSLNFANPWTVRLENMTVREVFNRIAQQFGASYGWQFSGAEDFRALTFHQRLLPQPRHKQTVSHGAGGQ
jgi:hypothetical protein